jgi:protein-tyrosine-phosphatase
MPTIVFVCTANICRSPVAAALFADWLRRNETPGEWRVESAGTWAEEGAPASGFSRDVLAERGLDLGSHRSRRVERPLVAAADLLLCMTASQREALRYELPDLARKIYLLSGLAGPAYDIADPYGGPRQGYVEMADELQHLLEAAGPRIVALAAPKDQAARAAEPAAPAEHAGEK